MLKSIVMRIPNSLVLILDPTRGEIPAAIDSLVVATSSCIAVGCLCEVDGETEIILGDVAIVSMPGPPVFQGILETPDRKIAVLTCLNETLLEESVPHPETQIHIWANHPTEPSQIRIGVGMPNRG